MVRSEEEGDEDRNFNNRMYKERHIKVMVQCSICLLFFMIFVLAFTLWLVYRPKSPEFAVVGAGISKMMMLPGWQVWTTMEFEMVTRNPNKYVSIYYDELVGMVLYKDQQITPQVMLSPVISEKNSRMEISPVLGGGAVVVTEEMANEIVRSGKEIWVRVVLRGRVKWKLGGIKIGYYAVCVECDVLMNFNTKKGFMGPLLLPHSTPCKLDFV